MTHSPRTLLAGLLAALAALSACQGGAQAPPSPATQPAKEAATPKLEPESQQPRNQAPDPLPKAEPEPQPGPDTSLGARSPALGKIYVQELGERLPAEDLELTLRALAYFFPNPTVVLAPRELPKAAYYPPRQRYRAEKLLDALLEQTPDDAQVVIGLTTVDISTTKDQYEDWGILGLATVSGRQCVISRFRAARGAKNPEHTRQRLAKTVVHEIGHTLGLPHCPQHGCLMEDGKGSVLTTDHELDFCASCRTLVGDQLLGKRGSLPWEPPAHQP